MHGSLNGLPVDSKNYVLGINESEDMESLMSKMGDHGVQVHPVWFHEHNMRDGSIRCATQQLLRTPD